MRGVLSRDRLAQQQCRLLHCSMLETTEVGRRPWGRAHCLPPLSQSSFLVIIFQSGHAIPLAVILPRQAVSMWRVMSTEHTFDSIPSAKRCHRPCAHPPVVCLLQLLFSESKVLPVSCLPGTLLLHMDACLLRLSLSFIFSVFEQKGCSRLLCWGQADFPGR